jgi:hypothetical protein
MKLHPVIPALRLAQDRLPYGQAGIQSIQQVAHSEATPDFLPFYGLIYLLDSRLRGSDGAQRGRSV